MTHPIARVLYLGGARSGKSTFAERRLAHLPTTYVVPGQDYPDDPEWRLRVATHERRRPSHWRTLQTGDLVSTIATARPNEPVLVDCLTLWLTRLLDEQDAWDQKPADVLAAITSQVSAFTSAIAAVPGGLVIVSNEIGSGVVPSTRSGRLFRDLLGMCNAAVAAACDDVHLIVAGLPITLKGNPHE